MPEKPPTSISTAVANNTTKRENQDTIVDYVAANVRKIAQRQRFNATSLGSALGIPSSSISNYWTGKRAWPIELLPALAAQLNVSTAEFFGENTHQSVGFGANDPRISYTHEVEMSADTVELDQIDLKYGLGGTYADGPIEVEKRPFSREWLRSITPTAPGHLFWAIGDGDSMEPTIRSGEVILIDRSVDTPRFDDNIWAVVHGEIGMIKRLRQLPDGVVELHSDNQNVRPQTAVDGELHIVGRVIAVVRRL